MSQSQLMLITICSGDVKSLKHMCCHLGIDYGHGYRTLTRFEREQLVETQHFGIGRPIRITPTPLAFSKLQFPLF